MVTANKNKKGSRPALGKGLNALIPGASSVSNRAGEPVLKEYMKCPVNRIKPDKNQPRRYFDKESLDDLVVSIREQGIIQPLIVRRIADGYELIAGERRWRASQMAGLKEVPIVIKDVSDSAAFEMALVENIQREDLNPIEEAMAISRLIEEHNYTQIQLSERIGKNRSTIANSMRLLKLPVDVQQMVTSRELTEGHARAILQADSEKSMIALAKMAVLKKYSVRTTEIQARKLAHGKELVEKIPKENKAANNPQVKSLIERLERAIGARVEISDNGGKGKLTIQYTSYEELDRILDKMLQ
ncbi:MAG: ParB/RepB/Spo0J family partition protein [Deltaproteobacteria bacterium]|nr:ParB/RepB/Spo0J family partition protein [Deltaproteobacteria bacterium]